MLYSFITYAQLLPRKYPREINSVFHNAIPKPLNNKKLEMDCLRIPDTKEIYVLHKGISLAKNTALELYLLKKLKDVSKAAFDFGNIFIIKVIHLLPKFLPM